MLLLAIAQYGTAFAMQGASDGFEHEVLDFSSEDESSNRPFNRLHVMSFSNSAASSSSAGAQVDQRHDILAQLFAHESFDFADDDSTADAALPVQQQQQSVQPVTIIPLVRLKDLTAQGTLKEVDFCIQNLIHHNSELQPMLLMELARIEKDMADPEFQAEIEVNVKSYLAHDQAFTFASPVKRQYLVAREVEFKCAQYKGFAFAQLFSEQQVVSPPASPRKRTYKALLTGTPQASPCKRGAKRTVSFAEFADVDIIPNIKRDNKRARQ